MSALIAGMAGIMVAAYGNGVLGQMPTAFLIYSSMAIMSNPEIFEDSKFKRLAPITKKNMVRKLE